MTEQLKPNQILWLTCTHTHMLKSKGVAVMNGSMSYRHCSYQDNNISSGLIKTKCWNMDISSLPYFNTQILLFAELHLENDIVNWAGFSCRGGILWFNLTLPLNLQHSNFKGIFKEIAVNKSWALKNNYRLIDKQRPQKHTVVSIYCIQPSPQSV